MRINYQECQDKLDKFHDKLERDVKAQRAASGKRRWNDDDEEAASRSDRQVQSNGTIHLQNQQATAPQADQEASTEPPLFRVIHGHEYILHKALGYANHSTVYRKAPEAQGEARLFCTYCGVMAPKEGFQSGCKARPVYKSS